ALCTRGVRARARAAGGGSYGASVELQRLTCGSSIAAAVDELDRAAPNPSVALALSKLGEQLLERLRDQMTVDWGDLAVAVRMVQQWDQARVAGRGPPRELLARRLALVNRAVPPHVGQRREARHLGDPSTPLPKRGVAPVPGVV